jgi:hypothetical protein
LDVARKRSSGGGERAVRLGRIGRAEDGVPRDEEVAARGASLVDRLERDSAVHLEHDLGRQQLAQLGEPGGRGGDVALASPARVDAHQQAEIDDVGDRLDRLDRSAGVDHDPCRAAELADQLEPVVDVRSRLGVDGYDVGARFRERLDLPLRAVDHQVYVENRAAAVDELAQRFDDERPDRDRGDEVTVHHVDVDHLRARVEDHRHVPAQVGEVRREDRRRDVGTWN